MTAEGDARRVLLHGTQARWADGVLESGLVRPTQAAFVVPAGALGRGDARLRRTLAVALFHAVGLDGWGRAAQALRGGERAWADPALVLWSERAGWALPDAPQRYEIDGAAEGALVGPGPTFPYQRVRDVGSLAVDAQPLTVVRLGPAETTAGLSRRDARERPRWYARPGAESPRVPLPTAATCAALAERALSSLRATVERSSEESA